MTKSLGRLNEKLKSLVQFIVNMTKSLLNKKLRSSLWTCWKTTGLSGSIFSICASNKASSSNGTEMQENSGKNQIPKWVSEVNSKEKDAYGNSSSLCYIYKVRKKLRVGSVDKFEPRVVSIGPYHINVKNLEVTQDIKELFVQSLISRATQGTMTENFVLNNMWKEINKLQADFRKCYSPKPDLNDEDFVKMLILDGCFILELLYEHQLNEKGKTDILFQNKWIIPCLQHDLVLLENQIPFSVLTKLSELVPSIPKLETGMQAIASVPASTTQFSGVFLQRCFELFRQGRDPPEQTRTPQEMDTTQPRSSPQTYSLKELILNFFDPILPTPNQNNIDHSTTDKHLLDLLRTHLLQQDDTGKNVDVGDDPIWEHTTCATDLQNAGVIFKKKETNKGLLDITFSNETLEIPPFYFGKLWSIFFLNMIALEQCRHDYSDKITSYAILVDNLIDTSDDVKILREKSIITGSKEEDKTIADIVNNLSKEAIYENFHYDHVCSRLNEYRKKKVKRWRAAFYQNYIHTPWAGVSLIGALIILVLSLIQTVFAILQWKLAFDGSGKRIHSEN